MDEHGKPVPKDAEEFVAKETGGELSNPDDSDSEKPEEPSEELSDEPSNQSAEFQLTPEIEEKVMEKVQDIFEYDVASTRVGSISLHEPIGNNIRKILNQGLLGKIGTGPENYPATITSEHWATNYKKHRNAFVYFNIMGRIDDLNRDNDEGLQEIDPNGNWGDIFYMRQTSAENLRLSLVFDLSYHKEAKPTHGPAEFYEDIPSGFFALQFGRKQWDKSFGDKTPDQITRQDILTSGSEGAFNIKNKISAFSSDFGFALSPRVSPKLFQGFILSLPDQLIDEEKIKLQQKIIELANTELDTNRKKPERLIPIYDNSGNLLWPRQMSYEEVKQFVAERDAKKAQSASEQPQSEPQEEPPVDVSEPI